MKTILPDIYIPAARDVVLEGTQKSGTPLSERLEFRLSVAVARFIGNPIDCDMLTTRLARASESKASAEEACKLGDECLITCVVFPDRLRRTGGSVTYYSSVGRSAYDMAGMTEEVHGFSLMMTVLSAAIRIPVYCLSDLLDRAAAGDKIAERDLGTVTPFRRSTRFRDLAF